MNILTVHYVLYSKINSVVSTFKQYFFFLFRTRLGSVAQDNNIFMNSKHQQQQAHVIPVTLVEKTRSTSNSNIAAPIISTSSHEIAKSSYDYYDYYASSKSSKDNIIESSTKYPSNSNLVIGSVKVIILIRN